LRAELERWARILTSAPTTLMQRAVPRLLERTIDDGALRVERDAYLGELVALGYEVVPPDGTWFVYARTPAPDDFEFTEQLARAGLLVLPAPVFHHRGWFRLSLTATAEQRERSLASLAAAR
jgi:aspartate aminotransferase